MSRTRMDSAAQVQEHYSVDGIRARVDAALAEAGFAEGAIDWKELAQLDQFHMRGLEATEELAAGLEITNEQIVLDVGSGLGGPARYLAATHGCRVTGIELTPVFVQISQLLSERARLNDKIEFIEGNALKMPFHDHSFDVAWTQHVSMNIEEKDQLYREVFRVLKPGSRFGIYDVVAGEGAMTFPVPWASREEFSYVATPDELQEELLEAGFELLSIQDTTGEALKWFAQFQRSRQTPPKRTLLNLGAILGPQAKEITHNFALNLNNGSAKLLQVIALKPLASVASV